ncbi:MAG: transposase, partial [Proteobacteria bacterium]
MSKATQEAGYSVGNRVDDAHWERMLAILPPDAHRKGGMRQTREFVEIILWIAISHSTWSRVPSGSASPHATMVRFHRWLEGGLWGRVVANLEDLPQERVALETLMARHLQRKRKTAKDTSPYT